VGHEHNRLPTTCVAESQKVNPGASLVLVALAVLAIATAAATATAPAAASAAATTTAATAATAATPTATAAVSATAAAFTTATTARGRTAAGATVERGHIFGLGSLLPLTYFKLDFLSFLELAKAPALNRGEVHETILAAIVWRDKAIPLLSIEPLHYPCRAHRAQSPLAVCS
jgi:hypothetical protein